MEVRAFIGPHLYTLPLDRVRYPHVPFLELVSVLAVEDNTTPRKSERRLDLDRPLDTHPHLRCV